MLVDMAGSENIEQAGQTGFEAKMQVKFIETIMRIYIFDLCLFFISDFLLVLI